MIDAPRWWCAECRCAHEPDMDLGKNCFRAEAWREGHEHAESDLDNLCFGEWWDYGEQRHDIVIHPLYKVVQGCGHTTLERHMIPMAWCRDCRDRRSDESYNQGRM